MISSVFGLGNTLIPSFSSCLRAGRLTNSISKVMMSRFLPKL